MNLKEYVQMQRELEELVFWSVEGEECVGGRTYNNVERNAIERTGGHDKFVEFLRGYVGIPKEIYKLIGEVFDPEKLRLEPNYPIRGTININRKIVLNKEIGIWEKTRTLLHEILHFHPGHLFYTLTVMYRNPTDRLFGGGYRRLEDEAQIDAEVLNIMENSPLLVKYLQGKIIEVEAKD